MGDIIIIQIDKLKRGFKMEQSTIYTLAVIADDFTGALDTGVQFAKRGAKTITVFDIGKLEKCLAEQEGDILVIDTETRHLSREEAYETVYRTTQICLNAGIEYLYKKTDSVLRGNIEAEIKAILMASHSKQIHFVPAYPQMKRYTQNGVQYLEKVPVVESHLGNDPFDPVKSSEVSKLFEELQTVNINIHNKEAMKNLEEDGVLIYDAESEGDMDRISEMLTGREGTKVLAGCAGLAASLAKKICCKESKTQLPSLNIPFFVLCGSVNGVSKEQIEYESRIGNKHYIFNINNWVDESKQIDSCFLKKLTEDVKNSQEVLLDTDVSNLKADIDDEQRKTVARYLGDIGAYVAENLQEMVIMIIGGDTVINFMNKIRCESILIIDEISCGTVLSKAVSKDKSIWIVSKSGGFGDIKTISMIRKKIGRTQQYEA